MPAALAEAARLLTLPPNDAPDLDADKNESLTFAAAAATAENNPPRIGIVLNTPAAASTLSPTAAKSAMVPTIESLSLANLPITGITDPATLPIASPALDAAFPNRELGPAAAAPPPVSPPPPPPPPPVVFF